MNKRYLLGILLASLFAGIFLTHPTSAANIFGSGNKSQKIQNCMDAIGGKNSYSSANTGLKWTCSELYKRAVDGGDDGAMQGSAWISKPGNDKFDESLIFEQSSGQVNLNLYGAIASYEKASTGTRYGTELKFLYDEVYEEDYGYADGLTSVNFISGVPFSMNRGSFNDSYWTSGYTAVSIKLDIGKLINNSHTTSCNARNGKNCYKATVHIFRCFSTSGSSSTGGASGACSTQPVTIYVYTPPPVTCSDQSETQTGSPVVKTETLTGSANISNLTSDDPKSISGTTINTTTGSAKFDISHSVSHSSGDDLGANVRKNQSGFSFSATGDGPTYTKTISDLSSPSYTKNNNSVSGIDWGGSKTVTVTTGYYKTITATTPQLRSHTWQSCSDGTTKNHNYGGWYDGTTSYSHSNWTTTSSTITIARPTTSSDKTGTFSGTTTVSVDGGTAGGNTTKNTKDSSHTVVFEHKMKYNGGFPTNPNFASFSGYADHTFSTWETLNSSSKTDDLSGINSNRSSNKFQAKDHSSLTQINKTPDSSKSVTVSLGTTKKYCQQLKYDSSVKAKFWTSAVDTSIPVKVTDRSVTATTQTTETCATINHPYNFNTVTSVDPGSDDYILTGTTAKFAVEAKHTSRENPAVQTAAYATAMPNNTAIKAVKYIVPASTDRDNSALKEVVKASTNKSNTTDLCSSSIFGGISSSCETVDISEGNSNIDFPVPDNAEIGAKYCVAVAISHADSHGYPYPNDALSSTASDGNYGANSTSLGSTNPNWRISASSCRSVAKTSSFQVWNGGIYTNGKIETSYGKKAVSDSSSKWFGSWTEQLAIANGNGSSYGVKGFASGANLGYSSGSSPYSLAILGGGNKSPKNMSDISPLTIGNTNGGSTVSGSNVHLNSPIIDRLKRYEPKEGSINYKSESFALSELKTDETIQDYLRVNGDLTIDRNIGINYAPPQNAALVFDVSDSMPKHIAKFTAEAERIIDTAISSDDGLVDIYLFNDFSISGYNSSYNRLCLTTDQGLPSNIGCEKITVNYDNTAKQTGNNRIIVLMHYFCKDGFICTTNDIKNALKAITDSSKCSNTNTSCPIQYRQFATGGTGQSTARAILEAINHTKWQPGASKFVTLLTDFENSYNSNVKGENKTENLQNSIKDGARDQSIKIYSFSLRSESWLTDKSAGYKTLYSSFDEIAEVTGGEVFDVDGGNYGDAVNTILADTSISTPLIFVDGDVDITSDVTRVDAWIIAKNGIVNTCSDFEAGKTNASGKCNKQLVFNGPIVANGIELNRTGGSGIYTEATQEYKDGVALPSIQNTANDGPITAAEIFNLRPDVYYWLYGQSKSSLGPLLNVYSRELAPRY